MSLWSWIRSRVGSAPPVDRFPPGGTAGVESGRTEDRGGAGDAPGPDRNSTTGTTPNDTFVGRAAGQDAGYLETGAEKRAAAEDDPGDEDQR